MKVPAVGRREGDWRYAVPRRCAPRCAIPLVGVVPSARLRRAVPAPTGRTGQRSAFPGRRRHSSRGGTCRDGSHAGNGRYAARPAARGGAGLKTGVPLPVSRERVQRYALSLRFGQRCRPEVGGPGPAAPLRPRGYVPRREPCRKWAVRGSRRCAPRCRSEDRRSLPSAPQCWSEDRRSLPSAPRCRSEDRRSRTRPTGPTP